MNYGKKSLKKNKSRLSSKKAAAKKKFALTFFKSILALILVVIAVVALAFVWYAKNLISELPDVSTIDISPSGFSTTIYDKNGNEIESLASSGANRQYVEIADIPVDLQHAFVAIEDERFYEHNGIDVRGIFRAAVSVIKVRSLDYGASTITQQLLKNMVFEGGNERSSVDKSVRKIQEQYLAIRLEDKLDKEIILEYYLNLINLGNGSNGIGDAAYRYFGKEVGDLTISEAAVIAPIAYWPSGMNPLASEDSLERNMERRGKCLNNMLENGFCTQEEYDEAIADTENVYIRIQQHAEIAKTTYEQAQYSYFVDELIDQLMIDLQKKGYTESEASDLLYAGGLEIYTTQDREVQAIMDKYYQDESV
ncbi:MAG: transglycosylase domain-containing protein, partial [Lachnospiraceae bacterium]|nr:transglycosylase domain-containing protein [Lachnospiraceae bacterium]